MVWKNLQIDDDGKTVSCVVTQTTKSGGHANLTREFDLIVKGK